MKKTGILFLAVLSLFSCGTKSDTQQINPEKVTFVEIRKQEDDTFLRLNKDQTHAVINAWNNAKDTGPYRGVPEYWIIVHEQKGKIKTLRTAENYMKAEGDTTFAIGSKVLFKEIYEQQKKKNHQ